MKKTPKPFTFEVKRSRLAGSKRSTFQRFVLPTENPVAERATDLFRTPRKTGAPASPLPPTGSSAEPLLLKAVVEAPVSQPADDPEPVAVRDAAEEIHAVASPDIEADVGPDRTSQNEPQPVPSRKRRFVKAAGELARGERWKRRLPQAAW